MRPRRSPLRPFVLLLLLAGALAARAQEAKTPAAPAAPPADPTEEQLAEAFAAFGNALPEIQQEVLAAITARIETLGDVKLGPLLALRDRAVKELPVKGARAREYYDPKIYADKEFARGRVRREPAEPEGLDYAEKRGLYRPEENDPPYHARVVWSFGRDEACALGGELDPAGQLSDFLNGYVPGSDVLVAWLTMKFDFDSRRNAVADHFDHVYCDLNGKAYPEITLYDAWSSGSPLDMPDVDVIAYARRILKENSWVSPIPPDPRRAKLYQVVSDGFLDWFKYRLWIEAAANLYVRPTAPLRETHEGLRSRLLALIADCEGDVPRIARKLIEAKTRDDFLDAMDERIEADPKLEAKARRLETERAEQHWIVARAAYSVLRERGLLAP